MRMQGLRAIFRFTSTSILAIGELSFGVGFRFGFAELQLET